MMMLNARTKQVAHPESGWDGHARVSLGHSPFRILE
jgi:hypothetical protein